MKRFIFLIAVVLGLSLAAAPFNLGRFAVAGTGTGPVVATAEASAQYDCPDGTSQFGSSYAAACAGHMTAPKTTAPAPGNDGSNGNCVKLSVSLSKDGSSQVCGSAANGGVIVAYIILIIHFLSYIVGAIIVLMLIIAGIQYLTSAGDPGAIKEAKNRIVNAITALVLFIFMYAILAALLPSGVLK